MSLKDFKLPPEGSILAYDPNNLEPPFEQKGRVVRTDEERGIVYISGDDGTELGRLPGQYELVSEPKENSEKIYPDKIASDSLDI